MRNYKEVLDKFGSLKFRTFKKADSYQDAMNDPNKLTLTEFSYIMERITGDFAKDIESILMEIYTVYGSPSKWTYFEGLSTDKTAESEEARWDYCEYSILEHHSPKDSKYDIYFVHADQICAVAGHWDEIKNNYLQKVALTKEIYEKTGTHLP